MSVVVTGGLFPRGEGRLFSARRVGPVRCKQSHSRMTVSVTRGLGISQQMRLHRWMMTGNRFFLVSEVAGIMTAVMFSTLSDMRKGNDGKE